MSAVVPAGHRLLRDAAFAVADVFKAGHPFTNAVDKARSAGVDTYLDRGELRMGSNFVQELIADGIISVKVLHPSSGEIMEVPSDVLDGIPFATDFEGGLHFLRVGSPAFQEFTRTLGTTAHEAQRSRLLISDEHLKVAVREAKRSRRAADKAAKRKSEKAEGRPSMQKDIKRCIKEIVDENLWAHPSSLKLLTNLVRLRSTHSDVSEATVRRALSAVEEETADPRFQRNEKEKQP